MSAAIGWVEGSWSWRYAQVLRLLQNSAQAVTGSSSDSDWAKCEAHSAKDSLSHRSSHQIMVTRSPNHMWASSCRIVLSRERSAAAVTRERKTYSSRKVMQPAFSMAPKLYSGTKTWS